MMRFALPPFVVGCAAFAVDRLIPFAVFAGIALFQAATLSFQIDAFAPLVGVPLSATFRAILGIDTAFLATALLAAILTAGFVLCRRAPQSRFAGFVPMIAALVGWLGPFGFIALAESGGKAPELRLIADAVLLIAALWILVSLVALGRSFAVLPSARRLVTGGPYRWTRHPLYLGESVLVLAYVARDLSWSGAALGAAILGAQIARMRFEERTLLESFGEPYRAYCARVGLLGAWFRKRSAS